MTACRAEVETCEVVTAGRAEDETDVVTACRAEVESCDVMTACRAGVEKQ